MCVASDELAVTERGTTLKNFTETDVELGLRLLVLNGGRLDQTVKALQEEGLAVKIDQLRYWREVAFPGKYTQIRRDLANDVGEQIAGRALERAEQIQDAEDEYIRMAVEKIDEVHPDRLAAAALSLARAKSENINSSQLLRNRPTEIREVRDTGELLDTLRREGVLVSDPRHVHNESDGVTLDVDAVEEAIKDSAAPLETDGDGIADAAVVDDESPATDVLDNPD